MIQSKTSQNGAFSMIRCGVGKHVFGIDMDCIRSIEQTDWVQGEGGADGLCGYLQTAREQIPVYSLGERLGQRLTGVPDEQRVVVVESKRPFALLVDRITPVTVVRPEQMRSLPTAVIDRHNDYFNGLVQLNNQFVPLLAVEQLRPDGEKRPLTAVWPNPAQPHRTSRKPANHLQIVVFNIPHMPGNLAFALSLSQVPEIRDPEPPMPVPDAPPHILGLVTWQGLPVPVLNLAHYWHPHRSLSIEPESTLRLLIAQTAVKDVNVALFVEPNVRLERLPLPHEPIQPNYPLDPTLIRGSLKRGEEQIIIPDLLSILKQARRE